MGFAKSEAEWEARAAAYLKAELKKHGFKEETEASVTMKLKRGTFNATWFLAALVAIGAETVKLEDI